MLCFAVFLQEQIFTWTLSQAPTQTMLRCLSTFFSQINPNDQYSLVEFETSIQVVLFGRTFYPLKLLHTPLPPPYFQVWERLQKKYKPMLSMLFFSSPSSSKTASFNMNIIIMSTKPCFWSRVAIKTHKVPSQFYSHTLPRLKPSIWTDNHHQHRHRHQHQQNPYNHIFKLIKALLPRQSSMFQFRFFVDPVDSGGQDSDLGLFLMAGCLAGGTWQRQIQIQMQTEILVFERLLGTRWLAEA